MRRTQKFDYVAFWDEVAWVAGTTTFNQVAQGSSLSEAIESLKTCLRVVAVWDQSRGVRPFEVKGLAETPLDSFAKAAGCVPVVERPVKGKRYMGSFVVEWDSREREEIVTTVNSDDIRMVLTKR